MGTSEAIRFATAADLAALPDDATVEILTGHIVEKALPSAEHGLAQASLTGELYGEFGRGSRGGDRGGWWFVTEVEIEFQPHEVYRPDIAAWRRETAPERPSGRPVRLRPDWVCEIISPSHAEHDLVTKLRVYQRAGVAYYWIVDPVAGTLAVYRWTEEAYLLARVAKRGEVVRAEPFEAIELRVNAIVGNEPER